MKFDRMEAKIYEDMKKNKLDQLRTLKTQEKNPEEAELTFKPKINKIPKSKMTTADKRTVEDLYKWAEEKQKRRDQQAKLKELKELEERGEDYSGFMTQ